MIKLKTLDDINLYNSYKNNLLLRYEVIKWIKKLNDSPDRVDIQRLTLNPRDNRIKIEVDGEEIFDENEIDDIVNIMMFDASHVIKWIKYFFGIKDDDLK